MARIPGLKTGEERLEGEASCELQAPHGGSILFGDSCRDGAGILDAGAIQVLAVDAGIRLIQIGMIEDVECLGAELHVQVLAQLEALGYGCVDVNQARSPELIATDVAEGGSSRTSEGTE